MMTSKSELWDELYLLANQYYASGINFENINEKLLQRCNDEELVYAVIRKVKSEVYTQKREDGVIIIAIGLILILAGFIITCFNFHSNRSVSLAIYGLTAIGISVLFWGLYKIMG